MSENENTYRRPIRVASTVLALGGLSSLAINLMAITLTPHAEAGAYVSGVFWPLALLASIELLVHTPWSKSRADAWIKLGVVVLVAGVAAWISYWHGAHVLAHWGYDEVGRYVGPLVPDAAMALATLALQRVGQAKRLATPEPLATVATPEPLATVATPEPLATVARSEMDELAEDWATVEMDLDRELAEMATAAQVEAAAETAADPLPDFVAQDEPVVRLTAVPALAAKRIQAALDANASKAEMAALDEALAAERLAGSVRTARRWRAAVANGTARVS